MLIFPKLCHGCGAYSDFYLLVTEPTPFGLNDLALAVEMLNKLDIPCGVVINRDGVGDNRVEEYCLSQGVEVVSKIPFDNVVTEALVQGLPTIEYSQGRVAQEIDKLWHRVLRAMRN